MDTFDWDAYEKQRREGAPVQLAESVMPPWAQEYTSLRNTVPQVTVDPHISDDGATADFTRRMTGRDQIRIVSNDAKRAGLPHEVGHELWLGPRADNQQHILPDYIKQQWEHIHRAEMQRHDPYPTIAGYFDDPSHSFADTYNDYVYAPKLLQAKRPALYNWFKAVVGQEYQGGGVPRTSPSATIPLPNDEDLKQ